MSYEVLRRARIRFDIALLLAFRLWFRKLLSSGEPWLLFVYMDASPQWRGRELFVASIDVVRIVDGERLCSRHLLPLINLGTSYRSAYGKTWAFLWMLVLVCGGQYNMLRSVPERIRSFTTDLGTEFLVRDVGDFLIPFMRCFGCLVHTSPSPRDRQKHRMPSSA